MSAVEALRIVTLICLKPNKRRDKFYAYSEPKDEQVIAPAKGECKTSNILVVIKAVKEKGVKK
jgi:hypothetical protein